jgi:hypothetical protein
MVPNPILRTGGCGDTDLDGLGFEDPAGGRARSSSLAWCRI